MKNDIGMDGDTYDDSLQLHYRQFLVALLFQQKGVQQEAAYSAGDHMYPRPCLYHFFMFI